MMASQETGVFQYGNDTIAYQVIRRPMERNQPSSGKMRITVYPDGRVVVSVPRETPRAHIQTGVINRARWIWKHLHEFKSQFEFVLPRTYASGETQFYLGRRYMLKVVEGEPTGVKMRRGRLDVSLNAFDEAKQKRVKGMLESWYRTRASIVFADRLAAVTAQASWVGMPPSFRLVKMQTQWGSCTPKGNLLLNPNLVKAPKPCIDYVITHELCHLAERNHGERFWRLLGQVIPHWKGVKAQLDGMAELVLNE